MGMSSIPPRRWAGARGEFVTRSRASIYRARSFTFARSWARHFIERKVRPLGVKADDWRAALSDRLRLRRHDSA